MTNDKLKNKLTKIALCDDGYRRVCLVNELEDELIKDLEVLEIMKKYISNDGWSNGYSIAFWHMKEKELKKIKEWLQNDKQRST